MEELAHRSVFIDLETGGTNPKRHPIIQLAAIAVDAQISPIEAFEVKIRFDEQDAKQASLRKNHYSRGVWATEAVDAHEAAISFAQFLRRHATVATLSSTGKTYKLAQLVAHNAPFDGEFLWCWYEKLGVFLPARRQVLCTLQRAMWLFREHPQEVTPRDFKLATLCHHLGVPFHAASAHDALGDVSATVALYRAINALASRAASSPVVTQAA